MPTALHGPSAPGSGGAPRARDVGDVVGRSDAFFRRVRRGMFPPSDDRRKSQTLAHLRGARVRVSLGKEARGYYMSYNITDLTVLNSNNEHSLSHPQVGDTADVIVITDTPPRVDHDDVIDLTSDSRNVDAPVNVSFDEDEEDNRRRQAVSLEAKLKPCFAEHVAHLIVKLACGSCDACSIEDPSQLHLRGPVS